MIKNVILDIFPQPLTFLWISRPQKARLCLERGTLGIGAIICGSFLDECEKNPFLTKKTLKNVSGEVVTFEV